MISVQPLLKQHLDSLLELEMLCFSTPWSRAQFLSELQNPNAVYLAATDGRTVVGYGGLWRVLDEGQITNIAVHPAWRRQGIAARLLSELVESCGGRLSLLTREVRESNTPARRLYEKCGFLQAGRRPGYYKKPAEAAILMTKYL